MFSDMFWADLPVPDMFAPNNTYAGLEDLTSTSFGFDPSSSTYSTNALQFQAPLITPAPFPTSAPICDGVETVQPLLLDTKEEIPDHTLAPPPPGHGADPFYRLKQVNDESNPSAYQVQQEQLPILYVDALEYAAAIKQEEPASEEEGAASSEWSTSAVLREYIVISDDEDEEEGVEVKAEVSSDYDELASDEMELDTLPNTPELSDSQSIFGETPEPILPFKAVARASLSQSLDDVEEEHDADNDDDDDDDDYVEGPRSRRTVSFILFFFVSPWALSHLLYFIIYYL